MPPTSDSFERGGVIVGLELDELVPLFKFSPCRRPSPSDFRVLSTRQARFPRESIVAFATGQAAPIAAHGTSEMPVWGPIFHGLDPSDSRVNVRLQNAFEYVEALQLPRVILLPCLRRRSSSKPRWTSEREGH
jgi:hypothetical protein